jgi:glycosyltransferase involved in cell wall biosynthesis
VKVSLGVSVIVPAYNEEQGLAVVLDQLRQLRDDSHLELEVIVVDDGSSDSTISVAQKYDVRLLQHPCNTGYGSALKSGILSAQHKYIVTVDADGTYPVHALPQLIGWLDGHGYHLVIGDRTAYFPNDSIFKQPLRWIYRLLVNYVTGVTVPDANSGFRAFRRESVLPFLSSFPPGFSFSTTMTLVFLLHGYFVGFLPIEYRQRIGRSKIKLGRDTIRTAQVLISTVMLHNPVKVFLPISSVFFLAGLGTGAGLLLCSDTTLLLSTSILISVSGLIFCLGLLADLISKLVSTANIGPHQD